MKRVAVIAVFLLMAGLVLTGCTTTDSGTPAGPTTEPTASDPGASSSMLAFGLNELEDGRVQAVGILKYSDLEGGFWQITGVPGDPDESVAVIANSADFEEELKALENKTVIAEGKKLDGASIRMAGPEIEITSIKEISDTVDPAQ